MKKFTIEQIKKYIIKQDSMGDILYNLSEKNIEKASEGLKILNYDESVFLIIDDDYIDDEIIKQYIIEKLDNEGIERRGIEENMQLDEIYAEYEIYVES
jgi:hypothetical protein